MAGQQGLAKVRFGFSSPQIGPPTIGKPALAGIQARHWKGFSG
jgi:hypothetical protein